MQVLNDISLKNYNTLAINSIAREFVIIESADDLKELYDRGFFRNHFPKILGEGSNILIKDAIVESPILKINSKGITWEDIGDEVYVTAQAGENWHNFLEFCLDKGFHGLENLALIPGTVGAAPIQNIGAYGAEQSECFHSLEAFSIQTGEFLIFDYEKSHFDYRNSVFKQEQGNSIITSVTYRLSKSFHPTIKYADLVKTFENIEHNLIKPQELFNAVCSIRREKLPYPDQIPNAGSFFKNPEISTQHYQNLLKKFPDLNGFRTSKGIKLHAGRLIDLAGLKGFRNPQNPDAAVSDKHALVLVNYGNSSGEEIYELSEIIRKKVRELFEIDMEREVNFL